MKHVVIGIAGHVDHGKTLLTLALTGKNTDRLKEEQQRGITIEIGFAQLILPNGQTASIIDVPGHERFIRNMLAGAGGMDAVLLVVAADEGFMPQTQEHLQILSLLGMENGLIVLTKTDLVDEEWLEAVKEEVREKAAGTFLADAPMIPVSAHTGQGIDELKQEIVALLERTEQRTSDRPFRLPIDRVFSLGGFGVIVTGTLVDGAVSTNDTVMLYPQEKTVRIRELQSHDASVPAVEAGMRVAVNLTGVDKKAISRGCLLAEADSVFLSRTVSARLTVNGDSPFSVKNSSQLHFYQGTQELLCKVRLLDSDELLPGQSGYAQMMFAEPLAARNMDKFIVRFFSPMITVGGGMILDMQARRLKRHYPPVLERLGRLEASAEQRIRQMIADAGCALIQPRELTVASGLRAAQAAQAIDALSGSGAVLCIGGGLIEAGVLEQAWQRISDILSAYHRDNPLMEGLSLSELRERALPGPSKPADALLSYFVAQGKLKIDGPNAALADFHIAFSPQQAALQAELDKIYEQAGLTPPLNAEIAEGFASQRELFEQVFLHMRQDGALIALTPQVSVHRSHYEQALQLFISMFDRADQVTLAEYRTALGVSRKYAQMYLDYFDRQKISKLVGEARVLLGDGR